MFFSLVPILEKNCQFRRKNVDISKSVGKLSLTCLILKINIFLYYCDNFQVQADFRMDAGKGWKAIMQWCFLPAVFVVSLSSVFVVSLPRVFVVSLSSIFVVFLPGVFVVSLPSVLVVSLPRVFVASLPDVFIVSLPSVLTVSLSAVFVVSLPSVFVVSLPNVLISLFPSVYPLAFDITQKRYGYMKWNGMKYMKWLTVSEVIAEAYIIWIPEGN